MDPNRRLSFGSAADLYDRRRPSYPPPLVEDVLAAVPAAAAPDRAPRVLEVGAGTGKATALFAERGASVLALEPNAEMAALARRNLARFPQVRVELTEFEQWHPDGERFEVLICAQAWHWITPELRTARAREALIEDGVIALFWNRPRWEACPIAGELRAAYAGVPGFEVEPGPMHPDHTASPALWGDYGRELDAAHGFAPEPVRGYEWSEEYSSAEYVELLQTHSDHIVLPEPARRKLLAAVGAVIDDVGGRLRISYVTGLWLARAVTGG